MDYTSYGKSFKRALYAGNGEETERLLKQVAEYSLSYYDSDESFYHGWMLSLTALFLDTHYLTSNWEAGDGRSDLLLEPKKPVYPGVIFEFKVLGKNELKNTRGEIAGEKVEAKLEEEAKKGYAQIQEKNYEAEFRKRGIETIYKFGVAFYKKKLSVYDGEEE